MCGVADGVVLSLVTGYIGPFLHFKTIHLHISVKTKKSVYLKKVIQLWVFKLFINSLNPTLTCYSDGLIIPQLNIMGLQRVSLSKTKSSRGHLTRRHFARFWRTLLFTDDMFRHIWPKQKLGWGASTVGKPYSMISLYRWYLEITKDFIHKHYNYPGIRQSNI